MELATDNVSVVNSTNTNSLCTTNRSLDNEVPQRLNSNNEQNLILPLQIADGSIRGSRTPVTPVAPTPSVILVAVDMSPNTEEASPVLQDTEKQKQEPPLKGPKKTHQMKPKDEVTFRTHLTSLAHVSVVVYVYVVLKLAFRGDFVFFTWHPILMVVGWMLLMTEGFYAINKYNTYWRFKTTGSFRVKIHVAILSSGYLLCLIGFVIVYLNKDNLGKPHFATWHALFGLIALISTFPPVINGFLLWYKKELSNYIDWPRLIKFVHVSCGVIAFTFGALALILSVYTNWYGKKSNHSDSTFYLGLVTVSYPVIWAIYGPSVKLARVIKEFFSGDKED